MTNAAIKKGFGPRGSLHKKTGTPPGKKMGEKKIAAMARNGNKTAKMAMHFDYGPNGRSTRKKSK